MKTSIEIFYSEYLDAGTAVESVEEACQNFMAGLNGGLQIQSPPQLQLLLINGKFHATLTIVFSFEPIEEPVMASSLVEAQSGRG